MRPDSPDALVSRLLVIVQRIDCKQLQLLSNLQKQSGSVQLKALAGTLLLSAA